jgi:hypothetical protein
VNAEPIIEAVSRANAIAITDRDEVCAVTVWLDAAGCETDDVESATFAVGELPDGRWFLADLREYEQASIS